MNGPGAHDPHAQERARLERALADALRDVDAEPDDETALRHASWLTETLRLATIAAGEIRASLAVRIRGSRRLSFSELGEIMTVTRARAAEIVRNAMRNASRDGTLHPDAAARPEPRPVVAVIVTSARGVLITRRKDGRPPWGFVAGEVEPDESPSDAGVREVKEETGLEVRHHRIIGRRVHPQTHRTMIYMSARLATPSTKVFVGDDAELAEVRWASRAEAEQLMPGMYKPVRAFLARTMQDGTR